jgi:hypothetical protein
MVVYSKNRRFEVIAAPGEWVMIWSAVEDPAGKVDEGAECEGEQKANYCEG